MATRFRQHAPQPFLQEMAAPAFSDAWHAWRTTASERARANGSRSLARVGPAGTVTRACMRKSGPSSVNSPLAVAGGLVDSGFIGVSPRGVRPTSPPPLHLDRNLAEVRTAFHVPEGFPRLVEREHLVHDRPQFVQRNGP